MAPPQNLHDDICAEILVRLPADELKLLVRFTLVCKGWMSILTDPLFHRRYRHLHGVPPILGYLYNGGGEGRHLARFVPTGDLELGVFTHDTTTAPFTPRLPHNGVGLLVRRLLVLDSRHGYVLFEKKASPARRDKSSMLIWDPVVDTQKELELPGESDSSWTGDDPKYECHGGPFRVVFVAVSDEEATSAKVYSSQTCSWSEGITVDATDDRDDAVLEKRPATLVGDSIYFPTWGRILKCQTGAEAARLDFVDKPPLEKETRATALVPAADGTLRFAAMVNQETVPLWDMVDAAWIQRPTIRIAFPAIRLMGFCEMYSALLVMTVDGFAAVELDGGRMLDLAPIPTSPSDSSNLVTFASFYEGKGTGTCDGKAEGDSPAQYPESSHEEGRTCAPAIPSDVTKEYESSPDSSSHDSLPDFMTTFRGVSSAEERAPFPMSNRGMPPFMSFYNQKDPTELAIGRRSSDPSVQDKTTKKLPAEEKKKMEEAGVIGWLDSSNKLAEVDEFEDICVKNLE